jgi:protein-S-isoprenylcysteine O-methyltransferase Ste14
MALFRNLWQDGRGAGTSTRTSAGHAGPAPSMEFESKEGSAMSRIFWLAFGASAQLLFVATVFRLFPFLQQGGGFRGLLAGTASTSWSWLAADGLLAVQFAACHSVLLLPRVRKALGRRIPSAHYGCFFCMATCLSLLLVIEGWQPSVGAAWRLRGHARLAVGIAFVATWGALLYSLSLTGFGYQTGWTPWWAWVRGREQPRRSFEPRGAYRILRHPVYLSFLGLIWLNPEMTLDRVVLTSIWTAYIFIGSSLKDRRLVHYLGASYRGYQARVPGYPFIPRGPLARRPMPGAEDEDEDEAEVTRAARRAARWTLSSTPNSLN